MSSTSETRLRHSAPVVDTVKKVSHTLHWDELPEWSKDNEYILTGYRRLQYSFSGCLHSVFAYLHNESVNIHSHLWAAVLFLGFLVTANDHHIAQYPTAMWLDRAAFAVFLVMAVFCLLCSATFHAVACHSQEIARQYNALDYAGIISLIVGSFYPAVYYGFFCQPTYQVFYLGGITLAGIGAAVIVLAPRYATPAYRPIRTAVFVGLGGFGVIPLSHMVLSHGFTAACEEMGLAWVIYSMGFYLVGALIYANRFPERLAPGKFDLFFASHQIFHVHVVLAALSHYVGVLKAFHHWHGALNGTCVP
ncbi:HlyIII-domain-containing protein [Sistotremastrum niveocremeum HHB9708]|uniref:HlyIII-domain-containing protein n=1 Tax=Sistotremastrum niveocremeum HHB9708 TaxID=1314777 RepID=A0A164P4Z3_9AGAM|nr:HlyIII-domain-containing protein [Sistotremastrum niveocremeum HHB9708]